MARVLPRNAKKATTAMAASSNSLMMGSGIAPVLGREVAEPA